MKILKILTDSQQSLLKNIVHDHDVRLRYEANPAFADDYESLVNAIDHPYFDDQEPLKP